MNARLAAFARRAWNLVREVARDAWAELRSKIDTRDEAEALARHLGQAVAGAWSSWAAVEHGLVTGPFIAGLVASVLLWLWYRVSKRWRREEAAASVDLPAVGDPGDEKPEPEGGA